MARDLNETLIFSKVVELGSFTAAGQALGVPKATVSRKVQALEERLGARLLKRSTRRLGLTEAGSLYYEHARLIGRELDQAESAVQQLQGGPRGWLRFTVPYSLGQRSIAPLLAEFRSLYPEVRLEMMLSNDIQDLIAEDFDLALRVGSLPDSTLVTRTLLKLRAEVYASPRYLEIHGEPQTPEALLDHRLLSGTQGRQGGRITWSLSDGERAIELTVNPVIIVNDPMSLVAPLRAGEGLALIAPAVLGAEIERGTVRRVLGVWQGPESRISAVFPPGRVVSPKVRAFIDFLVERLKL